MKLSGIPKEGLTMSDHYRRNPYRDFYDNKDQPIPRRKWVAPTITLAILLFIIACLGFLVIYWQDIAHVMWAWFLNSIWRAWLLPNGWNIFGATPFFWLLVLIAFGTIGFLLTRKSPKTPRSYLIAAASLGIAWLLFAGASLFMWGDWNARHYNAATTYAVSDLENIPGSLTRVSQAERAQVEIVEAEMPDSWEPRVASATGATYVMQKTGDSNPNTELMSETMTYIYDDAGGSWTGIRNGKNRQPIFGVVGWSGTGEAVTSCEFKGQNELQRAFNGSWGNNLNDDIAAFDSNFIYADHDVYGYCDGDKPVIVIPGARVIGHHFQTALESFGVMIITGSPSGEPVIEFRGNVTQGELPGPVYPVSLVENQRDALKWSAGRVWLWQPPVGFEASDSAAQAGNSADFLLKSKGDGRLYRVTPLKPRNTDSQTIVAYGVVLADEITPGKLNDQVVYVLDDNHPNIVNFNDLENAVTQAIAVKDPGFFTGGEENIGRVVEFTPTGAGKWSVFGKRGGRAVYQIDVSGGSLLNTTVFSLSDDGEAVETSGSDLSTGRCDNPGQLSDSEIARCISSLSQELMNRSEADAANDQ